MKIPAGIVCFRRGQSASAQRGFTLPELLVAMTVFVLLIGGIVFAHLYGLSMFHITETKLSATEDARQAVGRMADEIRTCWTTKVGSVNNGSFVGLLDGQKQQGSALLIQPTTNSASFIIYFVNPSDQTLRRTTSSPVSTVILADGITNATAFSAQNHLGTVLTNNQNNRAIHINLEFYQPRRDMQIADYYKLETSFTRRALGSP